MTSKSSRSFSSGRVPHRHIAQQKLLETRPYEVIYTMYISLLEHSTITYEIRQVALEAVQQTVLLLDEDFDVRDSIVFEIEKQYDITTKILYLGKFDIFEQERISLQDLEKFVRKHKLNISPKVVQEMYTDASGTSC